MSRIVDSPGFGPPPGYFHYQFVKNPRIINKNRFQQIRSRTFEEVPRIGVYGREFTMYKAKLHIGSLAIDELGQIVNIRNGTMNTFGWRPLCPEENEEFMDMLDAPLKTTYEKIVVPTLPGIFSTLAVAHHSGMEIPDTDRHTVRAELNIRDALDTSHKSKMRILAAAIL